MMLKLIGSEGRIDPSTRFRLAKHAKLRAMPNLIDGRAIAQKVYAELRDEIASLKSRGATPGLAVVLVGDDPASGANVVVLGRSMIVGKPMALLLMRKGIDATVTVVHSRTKNIPEICRRADVIIAAIGRPHFVRTEFVREGATVIDVGINRMEDAGSERGYKLVGDVDFESVSKVAGAITPVPGGVGPMTIAMLMSNTVKACRQICEL